MKVMIIGWYGTETLGDRAILAGIISLLRKSLGTFELLLGSLCPFFTQRTIREDSKLYQQLIGEEIKIEIFDSKNVFSLEKELKNADLLLMGGGPLMDLAELYMVEFACKKAKKLGIKTALLGCGIGPLTKREFKDSLIQICKQSDLIILRDESSQKTLEQILTKRKTSLITQVHCSLDPSVECLIKFRQQKIKAENYIAVNLRSFPGEYNTAGKKINFNEKLIDLTRKLIDKFSGYEFKMFPMHYFSLGNDDREFLNEIKLRLNRPGIYVQNAHLSLSETIEAFQKASFCIGMRFHSVVFQTIVNGRNLVLDYTEPHSGKISGFLNKIDPTGFYAERYLSLQNDTELVIEDINVDKKFIYQEQFLAGEMQFYVEKLRDLLK